MSSELCHTSFHFLHTPKAVKGKGEGATPASAPPPATPAPMPPPAVPEAVAWPLIRTHRSSYKKDKWEQPLHRENMSSTKSRILYHQFSGCHSELFAGCFLSFFVIAVCYKLFLQIARSCNLLSAVGYWDSEAIAGPAAAGFYQLPHIWKRGGKYIGKQTK